MIYYQRSKDTYRRRFFGLLQSVYLAHFFKTKNFFTGCLVSCAWETVDRNPFPRQASTRLPSVRRSYSWPRSTYWGTSGVPNTSSKVVEK